MELLMILITLHVLGDFYLQTDKIAENKMVSFKGLCIHAIQYLVPFALAFAFMSPNVAIVLCMFLAVLSHFLIDSLKFAIYRKSLFEKIISKEGTIFLADQLLHILSILLIVLLFNNFNIQISLFHLWTDILRIVNFEPIFLFRWILIILLILKPANIIFRLLFINFKPDDKCNDDGIEEKNKKSGAIIGCLERILIVIFISVNQYSALGFILTAKSIARYDEISKDRKFAEYYLIGTLVSVVYSIVAYKLVFVGI